MNNFKTFIAKTITTILVLSTISLPAGTAQAAVCQNLPDLNPDIATVYPSTAYVNEQVSFFIDVYNDSYVDFGPANLTVRLENASDGSLIASKDFTNEFIAFNNTKYYTIPYTFTTAGQKYLQMEVTTSVSECTPYNNHTQTFYLNVNQGTVPPQVKETDLEVYDLSYSPSSVDHGDLVDLSFKVKNKSTDTSSGFYYEVFFDNDKKDSGTKVLTLNQNESTTVTLEDVRIPSDSDDYYLFEVVIDSNETDPVSGNNDDEERVYIDDNGSTSDDADLEVLDIKLTSEFQNTDINAGDDIDIEFEVKNIGDDESLGFDYKIYFDSTLKKEDYSSTNLDSNDTKKITVSNLEVPSNDSSITVKVEIFPDNDDSVSSNNSDYFTLNVDDNGDAELELYYLDANPDTNLEVGDDIEVVFKVRNIGTEISRGFDYKIYLDAVEQYDGYSSTDLNEDDIKEITIRNLELPDDDIVTLKVKIWPDNDDENTDNNEKTLTLNVDDDDDDDDDDNEGDLDGCELVGFGTYYGAENNTEFQLGVLKEDSNRPCYDGMELDDFTWTTTDSTVAIVSSQGYIETKSKDDDVTIKAKHKDTDEYVSVKLYIGDMQDDDSQLEDALELKENKYGTDISDLIDYLPNIDSNTKETMFLKDKADVLSAVETAYITLAEIDAAENFNYDEWKDIDELMDKITDYNFYGNSADDMIDDLLDFADEVEEDNLSSKLINLENDYESNKEDAAWQKYEANIIPFADTEDTAWYTPYVKFAKDKGIVNGYKTVSGALTGYYGPSDNITVAELLKMAILTEGNYDFIDVYECDSVDDPACNVMKDHWALSYYVLAVENNFKIVEDDAAFDPNRKATRGEVVRTFLEAFNYDLGETCSCDFDDVSSTTANSCYIQKAKELGIVSGDDYSNNFRPYDTINRAEVAKIVEKSYEIL